MMMETGKTMKKNLSGRASVYVDIAGEGTIERGFRNKGEAIRYLEHNYGRDWKKMGVRFHNNANLAGAYYD